MRNCAFELRLHVYLASFSEMRKSRSVRDSPWKWIVSCNTMNHSSLERSRWKPENCISKTSAIITSHSEAESLLDWNSHFYVWRSFVDSHRLFSFPIQHSSPQRHSCNRRLLDTVDLTQREEAWRECARRFASAKKRLHSCHCADRDAVADGRHLLFQSSLTNVSPGIRSTDGVTELKKVKSTVSSPVYVSLLANSATRVLLLFDVSLSILTELPEARLLLFTRSSANGCLLIVSIQFFWYNVVLVWFLVHIDVCWYIIWIVHEPC